MGKRTLRSLAAAAALILGMTSFGRDWQLLSPGHHLTDLPPVAAAYDRAAEPPHTGADTGGEIPPGYKGQAFSMSSSRTAAAAAAGLTDQQLVAALEQASGGADADAPNAAGQDAGGEGLQQAESSAAAAALEGGSQEPAAAAADAAKGSGGGERPSKPTVYLTFDDGPSQYTPQVLAILKESGIKATFFMVGSHVKEHPELVRLVKAAGHSIGNHSYDHVYSEIYGSFQAYADQTLRTEKALLSAGVATDLVRAPGGTYGNFDAGYFEAMKKAGYRIVDWNADSGDSKRVGVPAKEIIEGATSAALKHEMTVLLHDGTGHAESVKALPAIISFYRSKGYQFAAVTPSVDAPQFPLAKQLKWQRPAPQPAEATAFAAASSKLRESASWLAADDRDKNHVVVLNPAKPGNGDNQGKSYGTLDADLILHTPLGELKLVYGDYSLHDGKLSVPVRRVAEALGGLVEWDAAAGKAWVRSSSGEMVSLLQSSVFQQPSGTLRAPLTELLELLGQRAVQMNKSAGLLEVWMDEALTGKATV